MTTLPRVVIAAPATGQGKTTVATGLMAALSRAGLDVSGHKVGPDYIDPGYHALACGRPGRNLDPHLVGEARVVPLLLHGALRPTPADVAVIEGVMGLYDGRVGGRGFSSTAHVATLTGTPVVLVVDIARSSRSIGAVVHGMATWDPSVQVAGVILNQAGSPRHAAEVRDAIDLPVLGVVPRDPDLATPSRHLGLIPAAERREAADVVDRLAERIAETVDLDAVLALARTAPDLDAEPWSARDALVSRLAPLAPQPAAPRPAPPPVDALVSRLAPLAPQPAAPRPVSPPVDALVSRLAPLAPQPAAPRPWSPGLVTVAARPPRPTTIPAGRGGRSGDRHETGRPVVAVAGGRAFTFRYAETAELLEAARCRVVAFDPATDPALPEGTKGLYLGGGFPEVHAAALADNATLRDEIRGAVLDGLPTVAECAGLLYLCRTLDGAPMAGVLDADAAMTERLTLRYPEATAVTDNLLTRAGERATGHEFHRTRVTPTASATPAWSVDGEQVGFASPTLHASYLHTHWAGHPHLARRFAEAVHGRG
ncbi:cobyrinate a,c-diamide synthase [Nocardioides pelophilus]|uniref:cobyrinate a,c-diamide synthase n=1 Tax=Nocardioides pelophilus TaxID=2172019 RepID=UPI0016029710